MSDSDTTDDRLSIKFGGGYVLPAFHSGFWIICNYHGCIMLLLTEQRSSCVTHSCRVKLLSHSVKSTRPDAVQ